LPASYAFFFLVGRWTLLILLVSTLLNYSAGLLLASDRLKKKNFVLLPAVLVNIGILVFFKYFVSTISPDSLLLRLLSTDSGSILFPVGLSFYTLQNISYLVDISVGVIQPERNIGIFAAFLAFFPKITAGPVERGKNLIPQLRAPEDFKWDNVLDGLRRILFGVFYKFVIADRLALIVNEVFGKPGAYQGLTIFITLVFLSFQIYLDFAGYTSIALGAAKMLGIKLTENFKRPYLSMDIIEFWNRWHISFSSWLRDYIFFPLRYKLLRKKPFNSDIPALLIPPIITMVISGLWHGTGLTFLVWGLYHAFFYTINVILKNRKGASGKKPHLLVKIFTIIANFFMISFAWLIFRADSMAQALTITYNLVLKSTTLVQLLRHVYNLDYLLSLVFIALIFVAEILSETQPKRFGYKNLPFFAKAVIIAFMILCLTIFGVYQAGGSTFIYGKF
jgi:D-alanyl-lipoteichoic acid acyltransferase DltB (MBOAT superfamily)